MGYLTVFTYSSNYLLPSKKKTKATPLRSIRNNQPTNQPASHNNKTSKFLQTSTIIAKISAFFHTFHTYIILTYLDVLPTMLLFFESIKDYPVIYCKTLKHGIAVLRNTSIFPFSSLFSYLRQFRFPSNRWPTPD